jgi:Fe2+ transport system protein FeoA
VLEGFADDDTIIVQEFELKTGTITDGSNTAQFDLGLKFSANTYVLLRYSHTLANWQLVTINNGGSLTLVDSAIAVAANTAYRARIEVYGLNRNTSGHVKVRLYLNDVLVVETNSTTLALGKTFRQHFEALTTSNAGGPYDYRVARLRRCWNHYAAGAAL